MMEERLRFRDDALGGALELSAKISRADSILIVTPEYSGGYPGVLKNALDYLRPEFKRKAVGIVIVSAAITGGVLCLNALRHVLLNMAGVPIPASLMSPIVPIDMGISSTIRFTQASEFAGSIAKSYLGIEGW